jgi:integrase/recombinase XerD
VKAPSPTSFDDVELASNLDGNGCSLARSVDPELSGRHGRLRGPATLCDISAKTDLQAVCAWLARKRDEGRSPRTLEAYRREVERLFRWLWVERGIALSQMYDEDFTAYRAFLLKPGAGWISAKPVSRASPDWRPFNKPMTTANAAYTFTILNEVFGWLASKGYLLRNPIEHDRALRRGRKTKAVARRGLSSAAWSAIKDYVENWPRETPKQVRVYERARFLLTLFYLMGFRVGDVADNPMGAFERVRVRRGYLWFWRGRRKGGVGSHLPASDEVMEAVGRYRSAMGLTPRLPVPGDRTPTALPLSWPAASRRDAHPGFDDMDAGGLSRNRVYVLVKDIFQETLLAARRRGDLDPEDLRDLELASTHWMRHTAVTDAIDRGMPLLEASHLAGHANIATTQVYVTADLAKLHRSASDRTAEWKS